MRKYEKEFSMKMEGFLYKSSKKKNDNDSSMNSSISKE